MSLYLTIIPGNEHDSRRLQELLMVCLGGLRSYLSSMGVEPNIPVNPRNGRKPRPYNVELYKRMRSNCREVLRMAKIIQENTHKI
jgi:hypothetical protein